MPFTIFRNIFPKSHRQALHATKHNSVVLETYNQSNIEQSDVCTVRLRYNDKIARCRFFVVPGDSPALLGMPDIKLFDILKIKCEEVGD